MDERTKKQIEEFSRQKFALWAKIKRENREPTGEEDQIMAELDGAIKGYMERPEKAETVYFGSSKGRSSGEFAGLGEQLQAVMRAGLPSGQTDPRLFNAASGLNETVPSDGGFLLQEDFNADLLGGVMQTGVLHPLVTRLPIGANSNSLKIPLVDETTRVDGGRWGGVQSYWLAESAEKIPSKPKFRQAELTLKKLVGLCYSSDELLQDARLLERIIREAFTDEINFKLDDGIIRGTGAGQLLGFLNAGCLVTVSKEAGQTPDTLMAENVFKMYSRMVPSSRRNAVWLINSGLEPQLFAMSLAVGTGGIPVYMPAGGLSGQPYGTLFGRPVLVVEQASAIGDVGDICFIDPKSYLLAEKGGIESAMSIHVRFVYDESCFRFVLRVDGMPMWSTTLTPYKGSDELSPFVTLEAR